MKICIVSDYLPGFHKTWSGAELIAATLGEMLAEKHCEVFFLTTPWHFSGAANHSEIYPVRTPARCLGTLSRNFPIDVTALWDIYKILKEKRPDVVHINAKYLFLPTVIVCSKLKIPTVFTVPDYFIFCPTTFIRKPDGSSCNRYHGPHCFDCLPIISNGPIKKLVEYTPAPVTRALLGLRAKQFNHFLKKVTAYIALTQISKNRLVEYGITPEKIHIIYHYRLAVPRKSNFNISGPSVIFVGWLSEENGTDVLIEAFTRAASENKNAKLYLVGTGNDSFMEKLRKQTADHNITEKVIFLGRKDNHEALFIISQCDMVVVPHQWPKEFGPVILLEAMALGKPVITSRIGATEEFVKSGENGFLIDDYRNPAAFADKIQYLLNKPEKARRMGSSGKDTAESVLGSLSTDKLISLYDSLTDAARNTFSTVSKAISTA